jgi:hypothetical protein
MARLGTGGGSNHRRTGGLAEYETIVGHYETFKATAGTAVEITVRTGMKSSVRDLPPGRTVRRSNLVARLVAELPEGEGVIRAQTPGQPPHYQV